MNYIALILEILKTGLNIWSSREKSKYLDLVIDIERRYDDEKKKPVYIKGMPANGDYRDDLVIDGLLRELNTISRGFATATRANGVTDL